jgi:glutamine synthetase
MLSFENAKEVLQYIKNNNIRFISFYLNDMYGRLRTVTIPADTFGEKTVEEGIGFDASNLGYAKVDNSDMLMRPDLSFAFTDPIDETTDTLYFLTSISTLSDNAPFDQDLRHMVSKALGTIRDEGIADNAFIGLELEFFIIDELYSVMTRRETSFRVESSELANPPEGREQYRLFNNRGYFRSEPNDHLYAIRNEIVTALKNIGLDVKYHHHEVGVAQAEIEFKFLPIELMADATSLAKTICHRIAQKHGKIITFIPKLIPGEAGNGMHVHHYLTKGKTNVFNDPEGLYRLSPLALNYIGGVLKHAPSLLAFTNPTTISYRRLVPGFEAPVKAVFAQSNRSAAIRIPGYVQNEDERRFEFRTIDATCNPYLAYAAMMMAGLDGIRNKIDPVKEGFGPFEKNLYELSQEELDAIVSFPQSLEEALNAMKDDNAYLQHNNVFPEALLKEWRAVKRRDIAEMQLIPHPWEIARYYDL